MHWWLKVWHKKQASLKSDLKKTHLFRICGNRLFDNVIWKVDKRAIAGGLSLGLFVAFMPTIGFQMIIITFGAFLFKVNLPIALVSCWITNPLTAIPIYTAAWKLGKYMLEDFLLLREVFDLYYIEGRYSRLILNGLYLWTGSLIFSLISAVSANIAARILWNMADKVRHPQNHEKKTDSNEKFN